MTKYLVAAMLIAASSTFAASDCTTPPDRQALREDANKETARWNECFAKNPALFNYNARHALEWEHRREEAALWMQERSAVRDAERREELARIKAEEADRKKRPSARLGMSKKEVLGTRWGKPDSINVTQTARGTREQWVYGYGNYLYFENGVLTGAQTSK